MPLIGAVVCICGIVVAVRSVKLGVRGVNALFDWIEDKL